MKFTATKRFAAVSVLAAAGTIAALSACGPATSTRTAPPPATSSSAPAAPPAATPPPAAPPAATPPPAAPPAPAAPAMTVSQEQAVQSAQSYLDLGSGFSKAGLIDQLTSSAGEGFSQADAVFAVSYLHPDWNKQAVESAKGYLEMGGFSRASLIDQLTSSAGEGFTQAQAEYAANAVGL